MIPSAADYTLQGPAIRHPPSILWVPFLQGPVESRMLRTLSARIILGFAALTIAFGVITATVVVNMRQVEDQVLLNGTGYVRLALESKDLVRIQAELLTYLQDRRPTEAAMPVVVSNLRRLRESRDKGVANCREILETVGRTVSVGPRHFVQQREKIEALEKTVITTAPLYAELLAALPVARPDGTPDPAAVAVLYKLVVEERRAKTDANSLQWQLERRVEATTARLIENEHTLRTRTIFLGIVAVTLGLLVTVWVVVTLRPLRRLREGARRIAAGNYASRISDEGPAEVADLAREFNSMGVAIEERQRELVRSERLAAVGKMAAMITHEVRNPLASIGLNTELLEEEIGDAPERSEARDLCRSIHREVDRLTAITEEYLARARFPTSKLVLERVNPIVSALVDFVREDLAGRGVELVMELAPTDPIARLDAAQIRQCLINLLRNATDAVVAAGGGKVSVRTRAAGSRVEIAVVDTGVGIPTEVLPKLFDPFFSTKDGGSGLGLALTQQIVHDHHGELRVDSTVGRGTTFTVSVPAGG